MYAVMQCVQVDHLQRKVSHLHCLISGPEHASPNSPSYCTLPLFHPRQMSTEGVGLGHLSHDGHIFACKNPVVLQQAFHVYAQPMRLNDILTSFLQNIRHRPVRI